MAEKPLVVIKIGGSIAEKPEAIAKDIAALQEKYSFIIAHGGSAETNKLTERVGLKPQFLTSPSGVKWRYTNPEIIEVYNMAVGGQVSARIVCSLQSAGVNAVGLSGQDGKTILGKQKITTAVDESGKQKIVRDDFTGKIGHVNVELLKMLLSKGYVPVVAAVAMGESFQPLNIDGDRLAAAIASAAKADMMLSLTDVDGYYRNFPNDLVPKLTRAELDEAMKNAGAGKLSGGMKKKLMGCIEAIDGGVKAVAIGNGKADSPITKILAGAGTHITKE